MENRPDTQSKAPPSASTPSLGARVAKGAGWIVAARVAVRFLGFFNTIIVARLLAPEDFGIVAIGVTAMQLLQGFSDIGVSQAVIRFRDATTKDLDTLFTLSAIRGIVVAALLAAAAPMAAAFYGDPRVFWVFIGVSLFPLLTGLINPRFYEFERDLDFSREFIVSTLNKLAGVGVSVTIALLYRSYAAIIFGLIAGAAVQLALSYVFRPYRPRASLDSLDKVFGFAGWLTGVSFVTALNNKIDALIVARLAGADDAGKYYVGVQISELPSHEVAGPVARA
ncbi:MAG: oligosaccharide flippase family protein, partial [Planctomycetota bacterium]